MIRPAAPDPLSRRQSAQLSDTAFLIGRGLFLRYRHRGEYAEDLDLGLRLSADGYRLVFVASTRIVHSHNRPASYHLKRCYVEQLALLDMFPGFPAVSGDAATVASDVVESCAAMDDLVRGPLQALSAPCTSKRMREAVAEGLRARPNDLNGQAPARGYLDGRTRTFVARLKSASPDGRARPPNSLLDVVGGVTGLICANLEDTDQTLDAELLEDFKAALYKEWAMHCGLRLASVYWSETEHVRQSMCPHHDEQTSGV